MPTPRSQPGNSPPEQVARTQPPSLTRLRAVPAREGILRRGLHLPDEHVCNLLEHPARRLHIHSDVDQKPTRSRPAETRMNYPPTPPPPKAATRRAPVVHRGGGRARPRICCTTDGRAHPRLEHPARQTQGPLRHHRRPAGTRARRLHTQPDVNESRRLPPDRRATTEGQNTPAAPTAQPNEPKSHNHPAQRTEGHSDGVKVELRPADTERGTDAEVGLPHGVPDADRGGRAVLQTCCLIRQTGTGPLKPGTRH